MWCSGDAGAQREAAAALAAGSKLAFAVADELELERVLDCKNDLECLKVCACMCARVHVCVCCVCVCVLCVCVCCACVCVVCVCVCCVCVVCVYAKVCVCDECFDQGSAATKSEASLASD